jgi:hypothetical protein
MQPEIVHGLIHGCPMWPPDKGTRQQRESPGDPEQTPTRDRWQKPRIQSGRMGRSFHARIIDP